MLDSELEQQYEVKLSLKQGLLDALFKQVVQSVNDDVDIVVAPLVIEKKSPKTANHQRNFKFIYLNLIVVLISVTVFV